MKHVFVTFLLTLLLFSCQKQDKPNPFIEANKMEDILYDVAVLSGVQSTNSFAIDTIKAIGLKDIFKKYQIDSLAFMENNRYYIAQKKSVYYNMQMRVMDRLKKEKEKIDSLVPEKSIELSPLTNGENTVNDSIERVSAHEIEDKKIAVSKEEVNLKE
ncbi:DUF4296 domain-containing protein [Myroides odoratus]|uniref:DUF4296 domain-containing protein n=1 Tax=Myroides odoratus TaxID=256 RepID=UPI0039B11793